MAEGPLVPSGLEVLFLTLCWLRSAASAMVNAAEAYAKSSVHVASVLKLALLHQAGLC